MFLRIMKTILLLPQLASFSQTSDALIALFPTALMMLWATVLSQKESWSLAAIMVFYSY